jgi:hypothetical protein
MLSFNLFLIFISLKFWHFHESVSLNVDVILQGRRGRKKTENRSSKSQKIPT